MKFATSFRAAVACLLASAAAAQAPAPTPALDPAGQWQGGLEVAPGSELLLFFDLKGQPPALSGVLTVPQQTT